MNVANNYRTIYTYSYGNVSGFDISKARGVEEFYAILRSSLWPLQYIPDSNTLQNFLTNPTVLADNSIGATLAGQTPQINARLLQTILTNELTNGVHFHRLSLNLATFTCNAVATQYFSSTIHLTSLLLNVAGRANILIQVLTALRSNKSLVLLDIMYIRGDPSYRALASLISDTTTLRLLKIRFSSKITNRQVVRVLTRACEKNHSLVNFFGLNHLSIQKYIWRNWYNNIVKRSYLENKLRNSYTKYVKTYSYIKNIRFPIFISGEKITRELFITEFFNNTFTYNNSNTDFSALNTFLANCVSTQETEPNWGIEEMTKIQEKLRNYDNMEQERKKMYYYEQLDSFYHFSTSLTKQAGNYFFTKPSFFQNLRNNMTFKQIKSVAHSLTETLKFNWMKNEQGKLSYAKTELSLLETIARVVGVDVDSIKAETERGRGGEKKVTNKFLEDNYKMSALPVTYESYKTVDLLVTELKEQFEVNFSLFQNVCGNGLHIILITEKTLQQDFAKINRVIRNFDLSRGELKLMIILFSEGALLERRQREIEEMMKKQTWYDSGYIVKEGNSSFYAHSLHDRTSLSRIKRKISKVGKSSPLCNEDIELFYYQVYGYLTAEIKNKSSPILKKREALAVLQQRYSTLSEDSLRTELEKFIKIFSKLGLLVYSEGSESHESTLVFDKEWLIDQLSLLSFLTTKKKKYFLSKVMAIDVNFHTEIKKQLLKGFLSKDLLELFWKEDDFSLLEYYSVQSLLLHPVKVNQEQLFLISNGLQMISSKEIKRKLKKFKSLSAVFEAENRALGNIGLFNRVCSMFNQQVSKATFFANYAEFEFEGRQLAIVFEEELSEVHLFVELKDEGFVGLEIVEMVRSFIKFISESQYGVSTVYSIYLQGETENIEFNKAKEMKLKPWFADRKESFNHIRLSDVSDLL